MARCYMAMKEHYLSESFWHFFKDFTKENLFDIAKTLHMIKIYFCMPAMLFFFLGEVANQVVETLDEVTVLV